MEEAAFKGLFLFHCPSKLLLTCVSGALKHPGRKVDRNLPSLGGLNWWNQRSKERLLQAHSPFSCPINKAQLILGAYSTALSTLLPSREHLSNACPHITKSSPSQEATMSPGVGVATSAHSDPPIYRLPVCTPPWYQVLFISMSKVCLHSRCKSLEFGVHTSWGVNSTCWWTDKLCTRRVIQTVK